MRKMINSGDYFLGLLHCYINDQLNITYIMRFSNSAKLDNLKEEMDKRISELNKCYRNLYGPFLPFEEIVRKNKFENVYLSKDSKYYNLDLKNYEYIKLVYIKGESETEFIFTVSHIIMDGISIITLAYYLLQGYSLDTITSYINFPEMKENYRKFLKERPIRKSKFAQLSKYVKRGNSDKNKRSYISLRKKNISERSAPYMIKTTVNLPTVRKIARKYKISRENYLTLKLVETVFKICPDEEDGNTCLLNMTKNLRLNPINFIDEPLGNYVGRRFLNFDRQKLLTFSDYINYYHEELNDKSYLDELIYEMYNMQILNRLPRFLLKWIIKKIFAKPSEGAPARNITASFNYFPVRTSISFPPEVLKKYDTSILEFAAFLRVFRRHGPCFVLMPDTSDNYLISLTFNEAFMDKVQADNLLSLYKELIMAG